MDYQTVLDTEWDVLIVGGGPGGLGAALYTSRADLKTLIIEKQFIGGLIALRVPRTPTTYLVSVPHWFLCALAALPMVMWLWRRHRRWRVGQTGICESCGYDLRATPARCPECGRATT